MAKANPEEIDDIQQQMADQEREDRQIQRDISEMDDDTNREIYRSVWDGREPEPEDDGDRSLEEIDEDISGPIPKEEEELQAEGEQQEQDEQQPEPQQEEEEEPDARFVPGYRFREQVRARQRLEQELADLRARQQQYAPPQQQYQQPPQPQQPPQAPDMFVDPDQRMAYERQQTLQMARIQRIGESFAEVAEEHGDDYQYVYSVLNEALARNDPTALQVQNRILAAPNPGKALMRWGQDLLEERAAYQEQWIRDQVLDRYGVDLDQVNSRSGQSAPRPQGNPQRQRTMPSLNSAAGNGRVVARQRYDGNGQLSDNDEDIFNDIMSTPRR